MKLKEPRHLIGCAISDAAACAGALRNQETTLLAIAYSISETLKQGKKVVWLGNGGSAAEAAHLSAELVGRFKKERKGFRSIALTDPVIMTAVSNDYEFENVFSRQVEALVDRGDVVIGLSTSGTSNNVLNALAVAANLGATTILMTGLVADLRLCAPARPNIVLRIWNSDTARIQEGHLLAGHIICELVENDMTSRESPVAHAHVDGYSGD